MDNGLIIKSWRDQIERSRQKYEYLRGRWLAKTKKSGRIFFIRRSGEMKMPSEHSMPTSALEY
jgi:hypothetical protein